MGIGIDLGGTKIEGVYLSHDGEERGRMRVQTPRHDYEGTVRAVAEVVRKVEEVAGVPGATVGVGIPGSISPTTGHVRNSNAVWLHGHQFDHDLTAALGRPVRVENDANCFALSEAIDGAAAGAGSVFGVILGTGVGGGIVIDGKILTGANGIGGEWGHIPLVAVDEAELLAPQCFCGLRGCLEMWLSGTGLARDFAHVVGTAPAPTAQEIVALAAEGDPEALAALDRHLARLARMLGLITNVLDPEVIVLGGGLSNMPHLYTDLVPAILPHVRADSPRIQVRKAKHGDSSGVRGAARLKPLP
ncbi:MAG TPA: ROK family protein [Paracoccaceae bacterium]|nr:ROK family protein [Paracoccaceae bacterium]